MKTFHTEKKRGANLVLTNATFEDFQELKRLCFSACTINKTVLNTSGEHSIDLLLLAALSNLGFVFSLEKCKY